MQPSAEAEAFLRRIAPRSKAAVLIICGIAGWFVLMAAGLWVMGQVHISQSYMVEFDNQTGAPVTVALDGEAFLPLSTGETQEVQTWKESWESGQVVQAVDARGSVVYSARLTESDLEQSDFRIVID